MLARIGVEARHLCNLLYGRDLKKRRTHLQERRNSPTPVTFELRGLESNCCGYNGPYEVGRVEKRRQRISVLWMSQFSYQGGTGDDTEDNAKSKQHSSEDIHANFL